MLEAQNIFNTVVNHLRAQNCKSLDKIGRSKYRGLDNCKCAAGILIDDCLYEEGMEGWNITEIINDNEILSMVFGAHITLINQLQALHDWIEVRQWEAALEKLAQQYNLLFVAV
jgi:hypothetical protein